MQSTRRVYCEDPFLSPGSYKSTDHHTTIIRRLGNFTLYFVDASFYQVARGLILPITIAMAYQMQSSPPSRGALIGCTIVTIGFFVGALGNYALNGDLEHGVTLCASSIFVNQMLSSFLTHD